MFNFPWSNFHELNLDWILAIVKEAKDVFDNGREDIDYAVDTADEAKTIATQAAEATIADNSISTSKLQNGAVTHEKLALDSVTTDNIVDRTIIGNDIAENTIESYNIKNGTIIAADIADETITTGKLADGAVTYAKIFDDAVNTSKIADGAVTTDKISNSNVTTPKIADSAVTTAKIANGAVTTDKLPNKANLLSFLGINFTSGVESITFDCDVTSNRLTIYVDTADYGWRLWFTPTTGLFQGKQHSATTWNTLHTIYAS